MSPSQPALQDQILRILAASPSTVREVAEQIHPERAYTTVATVLARMVEQGRVRRWKDEDLWRYELAPAHNEKLGTALGGLLDRVIGDPEPMLEAFLDGVEDIDPALLDRLEQMIDARRGKTQ